MNEKMISLLSVSIPAFISIVGFVITIFTLNKNFQNELRKQKTNIQLDKMTVMPYEILAFMQCIIDAGKSSEQTEIQTQLKEKM